MSRDLLLRTLLLVERHRGACLDVCASVKLVNGIAESASVVVGYGIVGTMTCPTVLSAWEGPTQLIPCGLGLSARKPWAPTQKPCLPQVSELPSASMEEVTWMLFVRHDGSGWVL